MLLSGGRLFKEFAPLSAGKEGSGPHSLQQPHGFAGIFTGIQSFIPTENGESTFLFY